MTDLSVASAIKISIIVGISSTLLGLIPAIVVAWILARKDFIGKSIINVFIFFPMFTPPVVTGYFLLKILGRNSLIGQMLASVGLSIPFSILGAIVASLVVGFPLLVMFLRSTFASLDPQIENYALTAGYNPRQTFFKVVLPLSYPGIIAGSIVCFARSLGEFGATIVLAGNMEGETRTISMAIYSLLDSPVGESKANSLLLASVGLSFVSLVAFELFTRRFWKKLEWK
jgi:molybdate transport system permease protein